MYHKMFMEIQGHQTKAVSKGVLSETQRDERAGMAKTTVTRLVSANNTGSLRTTIPAHIIRQFDLAAGDQIEWGLAVRDGEMTLDLRPVKIKTRAGDE